MRASVAGVSHIVVIGDAVPSSERAIALAHGRAGLSASAGVHPHQASSWAADSGAWLREMLGRRAVVAAGEMGLDYHYHHSPRHVQRAVFDAQLGIAGEANRPAVIHAREADDDVVAMLRQHPQTTCILHSFSSGDAVLQAALERGDYLSFSGMVTFRSWSLDDAIRATPLDRLLLETDGPYLAPVPHRGKRNEPAFVRHIAGRIADVLGLPEHEVAAATTANAARLFGSRITSSILNSEEDA